MHEPIPILPMSMSQPGASADIAALARTYGDLVYRAAYRVLGDCALSEDVQQDVFLRLLESNTVTVASWPAWLTALAVRRAIDNLRKQQSWRRLLPLWALQSATPPGGPEHGALADERARRLRSAVGRLPRLPAECFVLRFVQGMELAEIASALGISVNYVSVNLNRATQRLETELCRPHSEQTS